MMKCAAGCVNKMACPTEEALDSPPHIVQRLHSPSFWFSHSPFLLEGSETACRRRLRNPPVSTRSKICRNQRKRGSALINKRMRLWSLSSLEEIFLFVFFYNLKCNMLADHMAWWGVKYSFQSECTHAFQMQYLSIWRVHEPGATGRRDQSLWWCVKRASSSPSMYFSSLPFIRPSSTWRKINKWKCDIQSSVATAVSTHLRLSAPPPLLWSPVIITGWKVSQRTFCCPGWDVDTW